MENFLNNEISRREIYGLLARFFSLPTETHLDDLDILANTLEKVTPVASSLIKQIDTKQASSDELTVEFTRLFVGPYKVLAPPYGSIYLESGNQIMGDSTLDVVSRYLEAGLEVSDSFKQAPDHISAELEFMQFLITKEIEAITQSDPTEALKWLDRQHAFLRDHLCMWLADFKNKVLENANKSFYKTIAQVTLVFVSEDFINLEEKRKILSE